MLHPSEGFTWIKNIVWELNLVISRGKGPAQRIQLITLDLQSLERSYKSTSITFWLERFKETVLSHRQKDADFNKDKLRLTQGNTGFNREPLYPQQQYGAETVSLNPWNIPNNQYPIQQGIGGSVFNIGHAGNPYPEGIPYRKTRKERRLLKDQGRLQQLALGNPGSNGSQTGWGVTQNNIPIPTNQQPGQRPNHYQPRQIIGQSPATPGRIDQQGLPPMISWGNETPLASPAITATPQSLGKPDLGTLYYGFCDGCGTSHPGFRTDQYAMGCNFKKQRHPDFNEVGAWATSVIGKQYAALGAKHLMMTKYLKFGTLQERERNPGRDKRKAGELTGSGMSLVSDEPKPLKTTILPGVLSHRGQAIEALIFLDTGNLGRTLIKREVARQIVSDSLVRKHDITYNVANGEPMHSCGSIELDVRITEICRKFDIK